MGEPLRDLKFRQVKARLHNSISNRIEFRVLNRLVNFSIKDGSTLQKALDVLTVKYAQYTVLRLFSTASMYSNPAELRSISQDFSGNNNLLQSWMCLETDKRISGMSHIQTSMIFARELYAELESRNFDTHIVAGGARSIHLWFTFDYTKYLSPKLLHIVESSKRSDRVKRLWLEKQARKRFIEIIIPEQLDPQLDFYTAIDPRRILPIVNTWNRGARKWHTEVQIEDLFGSSGELIRKCTIPPHLKEEVEISKFYSVGDLIARMEAKMIT